MSNLKMRIYTAFDGVETRVAWANDEEYRLVRKFLTDGGARVSGIFEGDTRMEPEFVYVEKEELIRGLNEYVKALREGLAGDDPDA